MTTYDPTNIFAKILRGEMPCYKVYEDDTVLSFMDIFPESPGHTLVIPKYPAVDFLSMPTEKLGAYMERVQMIARVVDKALQPDGIKIAQFNRAPSGQTVFHVHFHIVPRYTGVDLKPHNNGIMAKPEEIEPLAAKIRAAF